MSEQKKRRKRKHPRLPSGYGTIKYLGKRRRNPYGVYPPTQDYNLNGSPISRPAICYVDDWYKGFAVLTAYKAGTYEPGMEADLEVGEENIGQFTQRILADYNRIRQVDEEPAGKTFAEIYEEFYEYKYVRDRSREYSKQAMASTRAAYKNCTSLHGRIFRDLRYPDLQAVVDSCPLKHASLELIVSLLHQMYQYAGVMEIVDKDYSANVKINRAEDDEHGEPFTDDDLATLWAHKDNPTVELLLIMCYSGFRIVEYKTLEVNLEQNYFQGGVKTRAGKGRVVPIHSSILPLVAARMGRHSCLLPSTPGTFRKEMYAVLGQLGIRRHTPHDCRHTFSALCEKYQIHDNDRKRMLGHSFGNDITNAVYGHRSLEDLRVEIEKIKVT